MNLQEIINWHLDQIAELRRDGDESQREFHREIVTELLRIQKGESK